MTFNLVYVVVPIPVERPGFTIKSIISPSSKLWSTVVSTVVAIFSIVPVTLTGSTLSNK